VAESCPPCDQELERCRAWERRLLADLASVRAIIAGLQEHPPPDGGVAAAIRRRLGAARLTDTMTLRMIDAPPGLGGDNDIRPTTT